eukprot:3310813-Pyramimonas_sp.AAC.1
MCAPALWFCIEARKQPFGRKQMGVKTYGQHADATCNANTAYDQRTIGAFYYKHTHLTHVDMSTYTSSCLCASCFHEFGAKPGRGEPGVKGISLYIFCTSDESNDKVCQELKCYKMYPATRDAQTAVLGCIVHLVCTATASSKFKPLRTQTPRLLMWTIGVGALIKALFHRVP